MNNDMNKVRQVRGKFGEEYTARQLEQKGWRIVARNYRKRCGELDIVAIRRGRGHMVKKAENRAYAA